jgi:hypothetical protein
MKNSTMPAMPQSGFSTPAGDTYNSDECGGFGLTKREHFASMALQGLLSNVSIPIGPSYQKNNTNVVKAARVMADALLAELG